MSNRQNCKKETNKNGKKQKGSKINSQKKTKGQQAKKAVLHANKKKQ